MKLFARAALFLWSVVASGAVLTAAQLTTSPESSAPLVSVLLPPPDPCVSYQLQIGPPAPWPSEDITILGEPARLFEAGPTGESIYRHDASTRPLALIVDGNGFELNDYDDYAGYLAAKGFNVIVIDRPAFNGPDAVEHALEALAAAFATLGLPADTPVAVIGHSVGGNIAIDTVVDNHADAAGYDIQALVLLAPKVVNGTGTLLAPARVPALLTVYGSQDNDVGGLGTALTDAFAAYDRSGTESSTTCHDWFCRYQPQMHRLMVYIHGADHSGLVNRTPGLPRVGSSWDPYNSYVARAGQFCIAKAYTLAMLEWALDGNDDWKSMVHGGHVPQSIRTMTTAAPDELGNPAGSPIRLGLQVSPRKRSLIENFEDGSWSLVAETPHIVRDLITDGEFAGGGLNIRHVTRLGTISWPERDEWQLLGFSVPAARRDVTGFTHAAMRLGQLAGVGDPAYANPPGASPALLIGLHDGVSTSWVSSDDHGVILPADRRPNGQHQSVMSTLRIPLTAFHGIDKGAVESVLLAFPAGTQGTLLIDSVEWFKE